MSSSSSTNSSSSSSSLPDLITEKLNQIIAGNNPDDLILFTYSPDDGFNDDNDDNKISFSFRTVNNSFFNYSSLLNPGTPASIESASNCYVPEDKDINIHHDPVFFVDLIVKDSGAKNISVRSQEEKNRVTCQYLTKQEKIDFEKSDKYVALKDIKKASSVITATLDRSVEDAVIYANNGAIYRVMIDKYGPIWKQIKLLTPPNKGEAIFAVLVNPVNTDELFYATSKALYHSIDNGGSWAISDLPTNHSARSLSFSLDNRFLYLGAYQIKKK